MEALQGITSRKYAQIFKPDTGGVGFRNVTMLSSGVTGSAPGLTVALAAESCRV